MSLLIKNSEVRQRAAGARTRDGLCCLSQNPFVGLLSFHLFCFCLVFQVMFFPLHLDPHVCAVAHCLCVMLDFFGFWPLAGADSIDSAQCLRSISSHFALFLIFPLSNCLDLSFFLSFFPLSLSRSVCLLKKELQFAALV